MRPLYLSAALLALMAGLAACDPTEDDYSDNFAAVAVDQIKVDLQQVTENGKKVNGVHVNVSCAAPIQISNGVNTFNTTDATITLFNEGENKVLVTAMNPDGSTVTKEISVNVETMSDNYPVLPQYNLLTNGSQKKWKWATNEDPIFGTRCWGNWGWMDPSLLNGGGSIWWGVDTPEDLTGQLNHSTKGEAIGEESVDAYMVFSLIGTKIETYDANGKLIRSGKFNLDKWNSPNISYEGLLVTTAESILFPFQINKGGYAPTDFDVVRLTETEMVLCVSDPTTYNTSNNNVDGEGTFWRFTAAE